MVNCDRLRFFPPCFFLHKCYEKISQNTIRAANSSINSFCNLHLRSTYNKPLVMKTTSPGKGRKPEQYEDSGEICLIALAFIAVIIIILLIINP